MRRLLLALPIVAALWAIPAAPAEDPDLYGEALRRCPKASPAWDQCYEQVRREFGPIIEERRRRAAEEGRKEEERSLSLDRRLLARRACEQAGLFGQAGTDCALIIAPYISCNPRDFDCQERVMALARQARRQAEDANRPRTCTTTRSRVYPYEITTVCE